VASYIGLPHTPGGAKRGRSGVDLRRRGRRPPTTMLSRDQSAGRDIVVVRSGRVMADCYEVCGVFCGYVAAVIACLRLEDFEVLFWKCGR
jgi:hypothetical protein